MKLSSVVIAACVASASAFAPASQPKFDTSLNESLFAKIANMDLWAPVKDSNDYGARAKKNLTPAKLGSNSYIPAGMSAAEYAKIRANDQNKRDSNYAKNVQKAGKFTDYTAFYTKRGTDTSQAWAKTATRGHDMAKTKYDWSGLSDKPLYTGIKGKK